MKIEVELPDAIASEVRKLNKQIESLTRTNYKLSTRNSELEATFMALKKAKDELLKAADWLDPYRYDDD
jgi:cell division protein FtsB